MDSFLSSFLQVGSRPGLQLLERSSPSSTRPQVLALLSGGVQQGR